MQIFAILLKIISFKNCILFSKFNFLNIRIHYKKLCSILNSDNNFTSKPSCLVKSLTFKSLVKNPKEFFLFIGVMKEDNEFQSHAWIEHKESIILNDLPNIEKFKKIYFYE